MTKNVINTLWNSGAFSLKNSGKLLAQTDDEKEKMRMAMDPNTDPQILDTLADDPQWFIRLYVSTNPGTLLVPTLERLSEDGDFRVRCGVAVNPNICKSTIILNRLMRDEIPVQIALTGNPKLPPEYLEELSKVRHWQVLYGVGRHPNTYPQTLYYLLENAEAIVGKKDGWLILWAIVENPVCPGEILARLANNENLFVRLAVAEHKNTFTNILQTYINDPNENNDVRKTAAENLKSRNLIPESKLRRIKAQVFNA